MHSGKQFVRARLVMAPDPCGLVDVTGTVKGLRKPCIEWDGAKHVCD